MLQSYTKELLKSDAIAGVTVGVILIPQAIAYALLTGMPPIYGLYACLIPLVVYALFGTSRQISIGPVAITSILVMTGVSKLATPFSQEYVDLVVLMGLLIGLLQIFLGFLKMGFLVNLISQPVITGFISAAAIIIIVSQLGSAFGMQIPDFEYTYQTLFYGVRHISEIHILTFSICVIAMLAMIGLKKWKKSFPGALLVLVILGFVTKILDLEKKGVAVIGDLPRGLPSFSVPILNFDTIITLLPTVLTVTIIGYIGSIGIAKAFEMKNRDHTVYPNKELFALGIAKVLGAFFQALPSSGSYSRSAINDAAGGRTTVASIITAFIVMLSLLFLTPLFYYIPKAVLAAIILLSVLGLINIKEAKYLLSVRRRDFLVMMITFVTTLFLGIEKGILIGVILSFIFLQYYSSRPHIAELVRIPDTKYYRNVNRFPDAVASLDYLIMRFDNQLYFGNTSYFKEAILKAISKRETVPKYLILDSTNMHDVDSTGLHVLQDLHVDLQNRQIQILITGAIGPVRDFLKRSGFTDELGIEHYFMSITDAIDFIENGVRVMNRRVAAQYNERRGLFD